jgi:hypothetical protein
MESSELKTIIEKSGLSAYRIEKDLKIPNGTLNQVIKGTKKLPEKYEEPLRGLGGIIKPVNETRMPDVSVHDVPLIGKQEVQYEPTKVSEEGDILDEIVENKIKSAIQMIDERPIDEVLLKIEAVPEPEEVKDSSSVATKDGLVEIREKMLKALDKDAEKGLTIDGFLLPKETVTIVSKKQVKRPDMSIADLL